MKLNEIFDADYYDEIQDQMARRKFDRNEDVPNDTETSMQDFIIAQFEAGEISYHEAMDELKKVTPADEMFFWEHELGMAEELMHDE